MKSRIVPIGNSRGIRIPKILLERTGLDGEVEIEADDGNLIIRPLRRPRSGWEEAFLRAQDEPDDPTLAEIPPSLTRWDEEEWEWQ